MRFIKYSSLEVVIGAVFYQYFLYHVFFHSYPSRYEGLLLALSVWFIYLLDRQVDNIFQPSIDLRHHFHQEFKQVIWALMGIIGICMAILSLYQQPEVLYAGFALSFTIIAYGFAYHKGWLKLEKEVLTSILYGLGVGLVVWVREPRAFLLVLTLIALAYQNLCFFALLENHSLFYVSRLKMTEWIVIGLLSGIYASNQDLFSVLPFLVTFGITFTLSRLPFSENRRFWGDIAFWSPLIYFIHGIFSA
jgi:hypothetical protein